MTSRSHLFLHLLICNVLVALAGAQSPLQIPWSDRTFGPDGPWHALEVLVGSGNTPINLYFGGNMDSVLIDADYCSNQTWSSSCLAGQYSTLYQPQDSTLAFQNATLFHSMLTAREPGNIIYGSSSYVFDNVSIAGFDWYVNNCSLDTITEGNYVLPDGTPYSLELGFLSYGSTEAVAAFGEGVNGTTPINYLANLRYIPSASFGVHIGSVAAGISPSLVWGGFDQNRVISPVGQNGIMLNNRDMALDLLDISIQNAQGDSPFDFSSQNNILRQDNTSIGDSLFTQVSLKTPYMFLPQSTCDALASYLPVTFDSNTGLYFWNTNDPAYSRIMSSASYLAFTLGTSTQSVTIKAPWKLFDLTLEPPIVESSTQYFPCRPYDGYDGFQQYYILGRAFLQAAWVGIHWNSPSPPGSWYIAQAPGPDTPSDSSLISISDSNSTIIGGNTDWPTSWQSIWTGTSTGGSSSSSSSGGGGGGGGGGLSTGAQAGIGVAVAIIALLALAGGYFYWKKRRQRRPHEQDEQRDQQPSPTATDEMSQTHTDINSSAPSGLTSGFVSPMSGTATLSDRDDYSTTADEESIVGQTGFSSDLYRKPSTGPPVLHEMADTSPSSPYRWHSRRLRSAELDNETGLYRLREAGEETGSEATAPEETHANGDSHAQ